MKVVLLMAAAGSLLCGETLVIRNVTIHPVTGPEIAAGSVLVVDGKIAEVGAKVVPPKGAKIIEGKGMHAWPGMIDSATEVGLSEIASVRETNDTGELGEFNPQLRAMVAVNPASEHIPVIRANGITSVVSLPFVSSGGGGGGRLGGQQTSLITGQPALIHLDGWTWEDMTLKRSAAMELVFPSLSTPRQRFSDAENPTTPRVPFTEARRNYERRLRDLDRFFEDARRYQQAKAANEPGFKTDLRLEAMGPVLEGKLPVLITATRERAIRDAIAFADKQRIKIVLAGGREYGSTLADIKAKNIPEITPPTLALPVGEDDPYDQQATLPSELHKAGVKFAFGTFGNQFSRNLPYQAATAVAYGLPYEQALRAVTINAAEIWGVADQVGSLEKGKWADIVLTDGDLLETRTKVLKVFVKGREVDLTNKHTRLYEKYLNRP
jgi:imidazolonepropionase-like amidohydrolase